MRGLFSLTLFLSAALLFLVQPMAARMVLPRLGGTPAVWSTCMVFFQAVLLAGYAYAHAAPAWLGERRHAVLHLLVVFLPLFVLPIGVPSSWPAPDSRHPIPWLLGLLLVSIGPAYFVVSTNGPLLQRWFASASGPVGSDPYSLYAASNFGSLLALLAYPVVVEPTFRLAEQANLWRWGYVALALLTGACLCSTLIAKPRAGANSIQPPRGGGHGDMSARQVARWVALSFVPSGLMLSVTTYLTTDIAPIPLLWVLPLSLYLLSFVLVFGRRPPPLARFARWLPLCVLIVVVVMLTEATEPLWLVMLLHLFLLFGVCLVLHGVLATERPPAAQLTRFYLWLSVGGVLGGLFNGLVAPIVFSAVVEYPLVLVLACLLMPRADGNPTGAEGVATRRFDILAPLGIGLLTLGLIGLRATLVRWLPWAASTDGDGVLTAVLGPIVKQPAGPAAVGFAFLLPLIACYLCGRRPVRFGLAIGALLLAWTQYEGVSGHSLRRARGFFGAHRVTLNADGDRRLLLHGNTVHGMQHLDPARQREPLTYYHPTGPAGRLFAALKGDSRLRRVGLVGLGAGVLSCYGQPGEHWNFFEIDPLVVDIARNDFTFLENCRARVDVELGDARLLLERSDERFGLLVIDAFSSDAVPTHLLTREALRIYRDRIEVDGLVLCNISNRNLDLRGVLAALARDANMVCYVIDDRVLTNRQRSVGKFPSQWILLANSPNAAGPVIETGQWTRLTAPPSSKAWTDDYSSLLGVIKWGADAPAR